MMIKKLFTFLTLLTLAITTAWAGEKTITLSRNDGEYDASMGAYYVSKGGVQLTMTGGLNNSNYLLMQTNNTISFLSNTYTIKKIVFHCVDDATNTNLDVRYWGPSTMHIHPTYKNGQSYTWGTFSYSGHTGTWTARSGYDELAPSDNLIFECEGKPVRFASIDVIIDKENGDIYDLVTDNSQLKAGQKYVLVSQYDSRALQSKLKQITIGTGSNSYASETYASTPVTFPVADKTKVKTTDEVQLITLESSGNSSRPWYLKVGNSYIRRRSGETNRTTPSDNRGWDLYKIDNLPSGNNEGDLTYCRVSISVTGNINNNALIRFSHNATESGGTDYTYAIRHWNSGDCFRDIDYSATNNYAANQRVYLYSPSKNYRILTECNPTGSGYISLGDGVLNISGTNYSQESEIVHFFVGNQSGYILNSLTVNYIDENDNLQSTTITPEIDTDAGGVTDLGTYYRFTMPANDIKIIANFSLPTYYTITTECAPEAGGDIFMQEGIQYVGDEIKSIANNSVKFNVYTKWGWRVTGVLVTYDDNTEQIIPVTTVSTDDTGGTYSFTMPAHNVHVKAMFYQTVDDLYLLGSYNGKVFHSYGDKFDYDSNTQKYYKRVYFKGTPDGGGVVNYNTNQGTPYGYFCVCTVAAGSATAGDNWNGYNDNGTWVPGANGNRYGPNEGDKAIGGTDYASITTEQQNLYKTDLSFKIPAGVWRIEVTTDSEGTPTTVNVIPDVLTLQYDPTGGATAVDAPIISSGQEIVMESNIQDLVHEIRNDEDNVQFRYKLDDAQSFNVLQMSNPTFSVVNENDGYITIKVEGNAWIGMIQAPATAYFKVQKTPLHWIEHPDKGVEGHKYIVSDRLMGVYAMNNILWAKDVDFDSNNANANTDPSNVIDYMRDFDGFMATTAPEGYRSDLRGTAAWEQKNWVQLDFSNIEHGDDLAAQLQNKYIVAGSVKGTYADDKNYRIVLSAAPVQVPVSESGVLNYQPNYYCPANFMTFQGVSDATGYDESNDVSTFTGSNNRTYYFLNPKIQEYALITFAVWDKDKGQFVVPAKVGDVTNGANLNGAFEVDWQFNNWNRTQYDSDQTDNLNEASITQGSAAEAYTFHAIIQKPVAQQGAPARISPKAGQEPTGNYKVFPLDLAVDSESIVTGVSRVDAGRAVQRVTYSDLAGRVSNRPFAGVNIVVTRYTDGTVHTSKAVF